MAYRNIFASVYLYEWICTSRSDDLNQVLQSFSLEEQKEKLVHIVATQSGAILLHTKSVADQYKTFVAQKQQEVVLRARLEELGLSGQAYEMYRSFLEVNLDATAYFASAAYLTQL